MKKMVVSFLLVFLFVSFVSAGSEISTSFVVNLPSKEVINYVPSGVSMDTCLEYFVVILIVLAVGYFVFVKTRKKVKKKIRKKVTKRKKKR